MGNTSLISSSKNSTVDKDIRLVVHCGLMRLIFLGVLKNMFKTLMLP